jgi:hypothetical protein
VYIREGIDLVLRHYAHLLPGQLPLSKPPVGVDAGRDVREPREADRASVVESPAGGGRDK